MSTYMYLNFAVDGMCRQVQSLPLTSVPGIIQYFRRQINLWLNCQLNRGK